jgi:16S rRNA processing protein RimM
MGRISAPFGIRGWVKIQPFTAAPRNLLSYPEWRIGSERTGWRSVVVERAEVHGHSLVAKLAGCADREAAAGLRGLEVAVEREALPQPASGEYYRVDLTGLAVVNAAGVALGRVLGIMETGANDVLVVEGERERLLPFIADVVREVDIAGGVIRVDWAADD